MTQLRSPAVARANGPATAQAGGKSGSRALAATPILHGHPLLQAKLTISEPGDLYEQEADRVADQVMRMPDPILARSSDEPTPIRALSLQRRCMDCEDEELQRKTQNPQTETPIFGLDTVATTLRQSGRPLDANTRSFFEPRFGVDFGAVRIHTDTPATESARAVNALAYTVGRDVVFNTGQYAPYTDTGKRLLAHELTHVVQQTGSQTSDRPHANSAPNDGLEREADNAAGAVVTGRSFRSTWRTGLAVHRQAPPPPPPATLAGLTATRHAFNNAGAPDANNCAANLPAALGVDGPILGQNGMEMIFRINGAIPPGTEFEITRTRASGLWQRDAGVWTRVSGDPAGTSDDHHDDDECQTPAGGRIFVVDTPGLPGTLNPIGIVFVDGGAVAATTTAAVRKFSFAEWVMARNQGLGIGWQRISTPTFHRWHSILSVALVGGVWTRVDTPSGQHNEIELGSIPTTGAIP